MPILSSLVVLGILARVDATWAVHTDKTASQKDDWEYSDPKDPAPRQLAELYYSAKLYREKGMRRESDKAFEKLLRLWRQKPQDDSEANLMLSWAYSIARERNISNLANDTKGIERLREREKVEHQADLVKASTLAGEALATVSNLPETSEEKILLMFSAISVYGVAKNGKRKEEVVSSLDKTFGTMEADKSVSPVRADFLANCLNELANVYCPMQDWEQSWTQAPVGLVPDDAPEERLGIRISDFKKAEGYRLRAMAQINKKPSDDRGRIEAQRSLVVWFRLYQQPEQYNVQLQKLSDLVGSKNFGKLFQLGPRI